MGSFPLLPVDPNEGAILLKFFAKFGKLDIKALDFLANSIEHAVWAG